MANTTRPQPLVDPATRADTPQQALAKRKAAWGNDAKDPQKRQERVAQWQGQ